MKSSALHRITALTLAFMMLITSVGFSADFHFCKGELKSFSLIGEASSCHTAKKSCPHHKNMVIEDKAEKDCCSNQSIEIDDLDTDYTVSADIELTDLEIKFVASYVYAFFTLVPPPVVHSTFLDQKVLRPSRDIYVLLERFLL